MRKIHVKLEIREDYVTEVLQASQSHWGLLLRYETVSPFSFAMSNPDVISNKVGIIVDPPNPHQSPKNIFSGNLKCQPVLDI